MKRLIENLNKKVGNQLATRRYSLADMMSESYRIVYDCEEDSNLKKLAESHLEDLKKNPRDIDRLSRQLCLVKEVKKLVESNELKDEELVDKDSYDTVDPKKERVIVRREDESIDSDDENIGCQDLPPHVAAKCTAEKSHAKALANREKRKYLKDKDNNPIDEADTPDLTDEELEELTKHLENIRKERKSAPKTEMKEEASPRRGIKCHMKDSIESKKPQVKVDIYVDDEFDRTKYFDDIKTAKKWVDQFNYDGNIGDFATEPEMVDESKSYRGLSNFKKQSESKAFYKTFKKLNDKLHEGKALSREESIGLYKAANSALTQMSIELEHNPGFLKTFKESSTLLSKDVNSLRESLARGKAPSKKTMKSLAKFSEALLCEAVKYPNGEVVPEGSVDMDKALSYMYGEDRDLDNSKYTEEEKQRAINYWIEKTDKMYESAEEDYMRDWAEMDYEKGKPIEDYREWSKLCSDEGIEPSKKLFDLYMDHYESIKEFEANKESARKEGSAQVVFHKGGPVNESEDEELPAEDNPEDDFIGDDEGDVQSEEADEFDQEYADARVELHQEIAGKYADNEDPEVQEKLEQDAEEVINLPGTTEEQVAEINGEDSTEGSEGDDIEEEPEEEEADDSDITDDELEELKKHLQEMRSRKK